ncbi:TPA: hypothetical protein JBL19_06250 [Legionella pneumophila]|nr:hypothetical protein [Legionella pneumophila subsp. fraseri]HAT1796306.1 hypothetical protein [Legionella pneumophila]MDW8961448.1 hypothetical protein [Legionella pneumophila subsp. fraseri]MDW9036275.1 hypothetical protein [Legionella pneumophila subsp. fraseri]MDW9038968.1 hypothetical protein [Legionella pneumophila subsp. fraseri]
MSAAPGQAAGLAVGAAVGSILAPGIGTLVGASLGGTAGGLVDSLGNISTQKKIDVAALKLNQAQAHAKASEAAAIHAQNFRQALASQIAISTMRGGSGSLATQFGNQAYRTFVEDQKAIEKGIKVADVQSQLGLADITARTQAAQIAAVGKTISAFDGLNLNAPRSK